jgi:pimeloyl-ACP methyl ester carboxylesterase
VIERVDLEICGAYVYDGDPSRTAVVLPGAMLAAMPVAASAIQALGAKGWRVVHVWDEFLDRSQDPVRWTIDRLDAATAFAGDVEELLVVAKSLTTRAAGACADRGLRAVWLTPLLEDPVCVEMLRSRTAPALLVGGTRDPTWDGGLARELSPDVVEIEGADHGLARISDLQAVLDAVAVFV